MNIPVYNTFIHNSAAEKVSQVLSTTFISEGSLVKEFEGRLASQLGLSQPVTVNSGTAALHLALTLAGIGEGDEVILPAQTFVATGLVIIQQKAIPVFADIDYGNGNISVESIRQKISSRTKAIMPVHWGGYPCDMDEINTIAKEHNLVVIEDAAHALGATYKKKKIGSLSDYTCFSFQAIKHLTTGDGGAIAFLQKENEARAIVSRWFGIDRNNAPQGHLGERRYNISNPGFKYHLNDYAAALGLANMDGFDERISNRRKIAATYDAGLNNIPGLKLFEYKNDRESAYWLYGLHAERRDNFVSALKSRGVTASVIHQRIDRNNVFGGLRKDSA